MRGLLCKSGWIACRIALVVAGVWCALIEVAEAFAFRGFSMELDGDWFLLIAVSEPQELSRFISLHASFLACALVVFIVMALAWTCLVLRVRTGVCLCLLMLLGLMYVGVRLAMCGIAWKPLYVAYDMVRSTAEYRELWSAGAWTEARAAQVSPASPGATNFVFVIGESLTVDRMGVYGYHRQTTPGLSALAMTNRIAVLGPISTSYPDTARSMRMMLTKATRQHPKRAIETLPVHFRLHGYRTALVSAQGHWERYSGIEQMIFAACESRVYLSDRPLTGSGRRLDGDLLPLVRACMKSSDKRPFAVFVHLLGSHFDPADRLPDGFAAAEGLDDYDRSVRYTDAVLSELIAALPERTVLLFVSDHGESVDRPGWRDQSSRSLWRVPLVVAPASASGPCRSVTEVGQIWYNLPVKCE